jgi:hypothetical protein
MKDFKSTPDAFLEICDLGETIVALCHRIPLSGVTTTIFCRITYSVMALSGRYGDDRKPQREKPEQSGRENDVRCSMKK